MCLYTLIESRHVGWSVRPVRLQIGTSCLQGAAAAATAVCHSQAASLPRGEFVGPASHMLKNWQANQQKMTYLICYLRVILICTFNKVH